MNLRPSEGRGASYVRVSKEEQDPERQRQSVLAWCERHGLKLVRQFEDHGGEEARGRNPP